MNSWDDWLVFQTFLTLFYCPNDRIFFIRGYFIIDNENIADRDNSKKPNCFYWLNKYNIYTHSDTVDGKDVPQSANKCKGGGGGKEEGED